MFCEKNDPMPVRFRITLLFTLAVFLILGILCVSVYYFSTTSRLATIKKRLTNRAITTARLLRQSDMFDVALIRRIDSLTSLSLKSKSVDVFNRLNQRIYHYSDEVADSTAVQVSRLEYARNTGIDYFSVRQKEVVVYSDLTDPDRLVIVSAAEDSDGNESLHTLQKILTVCFFAGVIASFITGFFFSGLLMLPIRKITQDVDDISAYNLDRRIHTGKNKDEWYNLSFNLNRLFDRLKSSFEMQRRFISNASHELSTPLTLISSQLEIALQRNRTEEQYRKVINSSLMDVRHMNNLVQTLLQFASTAGNPGGLNIEPVRIDEILMRLPADVQRQDIRYNVKLHFSGLPEEEEALLVLGNEELLFSAIRNVVINACKYSFNNLASVGFTLSENGFNITVADEGPGMAPEALDHIFQPFYRIEETRAEKGFGLGLSLTYQILKLHKGNIRVQSTVGAGSTFTIELPYGFVV